MNQLVPIMEELAPSPRRAQQVTAPTRWINLKSWHTAPRNHFQKRGSIGSAAPAWILKMICDSRARVDSNNYLRTRMRTPRDGRDGWIREAIFRQTTSQF